MILALMVCGLAEARPEVRPSPSAPAPAAPAAPAPTPPPTPPRARYQHLVAAWLEAHGDPAGARASAALALLHDRQASEPRLLLVRTMAAEPGTLAEREVLLAEAVAAPAAGAAAYLARARHLVQTGRPETALVDFAEAERRGAGSEAYAPWLGALEALGRKAEAAALLERWVQLPEVLPERLLARAQALRRLDIGSAAQGLACRDARAALALNPAGDAGLLARACASAGLFRTAGEALDRAEAAGGEVAAARATLLAAQAEPPGGAASEQLAVIRSATFPAVAGDLAAADAPTLCAWAEERFPSDPQVLARCGGLWLDRGDAARAARALTAAAALAPTDPSLRARATLAAAGTSMPPEPR